ncbi:putative glycosyl transferase [Rosistilla oblonga]|nr:putative glycosyl transferase [Rosistilla oblonga]
MGAKHVHFTEYQPIERLTDSLPAADLHVESPAANIHECLAPSKLYGILASRTPVMAITPDTFSVASEFESHQVGRAVEPGNVSQVVEHVCWGIEHPHGLEASGEIARRLVQAKYERRIASQQIADVLNSVCDCDRSDQQPSSTPETYLETQ